VTGSYTYFADNDVLLAKITPCFENGKLGIARNLKNGVGFGSSEGENRLLVSHCIRGLCGSDGETYGNKPRFR